MSEDPIRLTVTGRSPVNLPGSSDLCCVAEDGSKHVVDFFIEGTLPEILGPDDLIGKVIEVDYLHPYIELAANPRIISEPSPTGETP